MRLKQIPCRLMEASALSVWVLDLKSDKEWNVISFLPHDTTRPIGPQINLVGWLTDK
ncbi:MAG TPA: hypothetical protein VJN89_00705 [Candidatus Acidoferrum sp.]|nr:hypothetical protein [Candidatus Acidoferrum sp.]